MMHLPALAMTNQASGVFTALSKVGFVVRGLYGEGTEAKGNLFQISNQVTLGLSEIEILDRLVSVSRQVIQQEQMGRRSLMKERPSQIEDMVFRAYGILTNARLLNSEETMFYLSCLRLGIDLGLLHNVSNRTLNELLVSTRAAFLQGDSQGAVDAFNRSLKRAAIIRKALAANSSLSMPGECPLADADPAPPLAGEDRGSRLEEDGNDQESHVDFNA
jgi:protein arginine kinase